MWMATERLVTVILPAGVVGPQGERGAIGPFTPKSVAVGHGKKSLDDWNDWEPFDQMNLLHPFTLEK